MSLFSLQINFEKSKLTKNVLNGVSQVLADSFEQDIQDISGTLVEKVKLSWQGTAEPCIFVTVQTIHHLSNELNQKCVSVLTEYLTQSTGVPMKRIFIYFIEKVLSDIAIDGQSLWHSNYS